MQFERETANFESVTSTHAQIFSLFRLSFCTYREVLGMIIFLIHFFYGILCVKFVREVRYFTSKVAIFSLSALVVRKVTGSETIG